MKDFGIFTQEASELKERMDRYCKIYGTIS